MNTYTFSVSLCGGFANGTIEVKAKNEDKAYDKAMDRVGKMLYKAFPTLGIDYYVELEDSDEEEDDEE